jgi:hypothetical protein
MPRVLSSSGFPEFRFPDSWHTRGFYERAAALYHHARGTPLKKLFWIPMTGGRWRIDWQRTNRSGNCRQQMPYRYQSRNHGLLACCSSCRRFAAARSLALSGLVSGTARGANSSSARRCGDGWSLCRATITSSGSASHRHLPCRKRQGIASRAGADEVLLTGEKLVERVRALARDGVHHVVEVAFGANIKTDTEVLAQGGSIATYATNAPMPAIPVWQLVFVNARLFFVGSDDVPADEKIDATRAINQALEAGWQGLDIAEIVPLDQIARAHELVERPAKPGRVIVAIT